MERENLNTRLAFRQPWLRETFVARSDDRAINTKKSQAPLVNGLGRDSCT